MERGRMVNNAGTGGTESAGKIHEMDEGTWDFVMQVETHPVQALSSARQLSPARYSSLTFPAGTLILALSFLAANTLLRNSCLKILIPQATEDGS